MDNRKEGSIAVLVLWIIFFWPVAIAYWFSRVWPKETFQNIKPKDEISKTKQNTKMDEIIKKEKSKGGK